MDSSKPSSHRHTQTADSFTLYYSHIVFCVCNNGDFLANEFRHTVFHWIYEYIKATYSLTLLVIIHEEAACNN